MRRKSRSTKAKGISAAAHLDHPFAPQRIFSDDRIGDMHDLALKVLEDLGMKVLLPEAVEVFAVAGARIVDDMVFIGRDMVAGALASAPRQVLMAAPNRARDQMIAEGRLLFSPGGGCPNVSDRIKGRRAGDLASYRDALRLMQSYDVIHKLAPAPEPQDVPTHLRHYAMVKSQLELSDKPLTIYGRGRAQVMQSFEMIQMALELSDDAFAGASWCSTVVNTNSPRLLDRPMAQALIDFARAGQLSIVTPFCLAGAMAPITIAGALVLQHAEALAAITLTQLARPGAPVLYGGFGSNVDMKSGAPAFGTPAHIQMSIGSGQLARHIGLPWRSAAGAASNTNDMQAAGETHMSLWGAMMGNANLVFHTAGWLEGGLTFGFEKFINDIEALQTLSQLCIAPDDSDDALGFEAISEVKPGGHFFETKQTMARYRTAFAAPLLADLSNFGSWSAEGSVPSDVRATEVWQGVFRDYRAPDACSDRASRIARFIADGTAKGGAVIES
jgi:trimethylamine--corrinoid protein Co-methyltransferase